LACEVELGPDLEQSQHEVVYGQDGRTDPFLHADADLRIASNSVALLARLNQVQTDEHSGQVTLQTQTLDAVIQRNYGRALCPGEAFANEPTTGFCTGFLVSPTRMFTAGHCLDLDRNRSVTQQEINQFCQDTIVVFGHERVRVNGQTQAAAIDHDDTFLCRRVVSHALQSDGLDYAVFDLDRDTGRPGLPIDPNARANLNNGRGVAVIGHPDGLPKKIDSGGTVRDARRNDHHFVLTSDTFHTNSGSPIIDTGTERVIGVLVRGDDDYAWGQTPQGARCVEVDVHTQNAGRGEDATHIAALGRWADTAEPNETRDLSTAYPMMLHPTDSGIGHLDVLRAGGGGFYRIAAQDRDWFSLPVYGGDEVEISVRFQHGRGDLDMSVLSDDGSTLATSHSVSNDEAVSFTMPGQGARAVDVLIYGYNGATNDYTIQVDLRPVNGARTCSPTQSCSGGLVCNPRPQSIGLQSDLDLSQAPGVCEASYRCEYINPWDSYCFLKPVKHNIYFRMETEHPYTNDMFQSWSLGLPASIQDVDWRVDRLSSEVGYDELVLVNGGTYSGNYSNARFSDQSQQTHFGRVYRNGLYLSFESDGTVTSDGLWIGGLQW